MNAHQPLRHSQDSAQHTPRYLLLDQRGNKLSADGEKPWACVIDTWKQLVWEVKSSNPGFRHDNHTYSWLNPDSTTNGGFAGYNNGGSCPLQTCNTKAYIDAVNQQALCGKTNWRLPTRPELKGLVNYSKRTPEPTIDTSLFPNSGGQFFWSSTADVNDKDSAWGVGFAFGYDYAYFKSDKGHVRLVSGKRQQAAYTEKTMAIVSSESGDDKYLCKSSILPTAHHSYFIRQDNGTIIDRRTKLMWMTCSLGQTYQPDSCLGEQRLMDLNTAIKNARRIHHAGFDDWRIPSLTELSSIVELACEKPAINQSVFPNSAAGNYWTSTTFSNDPSHQWLVHFKFGENHIDRNSITSYTRLVRDLDEE